MCLRMLLGTLMTFLNRRQSLSQTGFWRAPMRRPFRYPKFHDRIKDTSISGNARSPGETFLAQRPESSEPA